MKQLNGTGADKRQSSAVAPISDRRAQRISVIEPKGEGIKVCDGHAFDPYRFQEFDFSPAFREKMMRAHLPLLDLRQLHDDRSGSDQIRHAGPNDVTQPVGTPLLAVPEVAEATEAEPRALSLGMRLLLARKKLRKITGSAFEGSAGRKWKSLLFGSLLAGLASLTD